ncbi:MAG: GatB/YqeY domain-containing protein [Proteobacteria bacterium]|nr:GatB/YqeY domain-containing protein [Pseudomonadota bacterium]
MDLIGRIREDLKGALKAKDGKRVSVLRFLLAGIGNREIDKREPLSEEEVLSEITSSVKRRRESIQAFRDGDRQDLVEKEEAELAILSEYLPEQLPDEEIRRMAEEAILAAGAGSPGDIGKVMKELMPRIRGRADGRTVNEIVRELLSR